MKDLGYKYDSCYDPFAQHNRYGKLSNAPDDSNPFVHESGILGIPMPDLRVHNIKISIYGEGYF